MCRSANWLSTTLVLLGGALIAAAIALLALTYTGVIDDGAQGSGPGTVTGFGSVLSAETPATPPTAAVPITDAPLARILIPNVEIDAPIVVKGVDAQGVMQSPDNAYDVAWYDFTARPGSGSNAVFAGHVDYVNVGPAVFWRLKDLVSGDPIEVRYDDGTVVNYKVTAINTFDADTAPVDQIVGPTAVDSITLITCAGTFNRSTQQYDKRLVVRAEIT